MDIKTRHWALTLNNYDWQNVDCLFEHEKKATCITCGYEVGENGTNHLQIAISWKTAITFKTMKKKFGGYHIEAAQGTPVQLHAYCMKGDDEKSDKFSHENPGTNWDGRFCGVFPKGQGARTDIQVQALRITEGELTVDEMTEENPQFVHQYGRTLDRLEDIRLRSIFRTEMTTCKWYTGSTGCGKSHAAFTNFDTKTHYVWKVDKGWQDAYCQQETVIINDFRGSMMPYNELLLLIDKWPHTVSRRGRAPMPFTSKYIIITSILTPQECYKNLEKSDGIEQLLRRIKVLKLPPLLLQDDK